MNVAVLGQFEEPSSVDPLQQIHCPRSDKEHPEDGAVEDGKDPKDDEHGVCPIEHLQDKRHTVIT